MKTTTTVKHERRLLLIDYNNLFYRAFHVNRNLSWQGQPTGALFGMMSGISSAICTLKPDRVVVCNDAPPYLRAKLFPDYKADRKRSTDRELLKAMGKSKEQCNNLLSIFEGVLPHVSVPGLEADDLIAAFVRGRIRGAENFTQVYALSNDTDLFQLFGDPQRDLFLYRGSRKGILGFDEFTRQYGGLPPSKWVDVILCCGGHNGLPHPEGYGEKRALKLLLGGYPLPVSRVQQKLLRRVCTLPFEYDYTAIELPSNRPPNLVRRVQNYLQCFGIKFTSAMLDAITIMERAHG